MLQGVFRYKPTKESTWLEWPYKENYIKPTNPILKCKCKDGQPLILHDDFFQTSIRIHSIILSDGTLWSVED